MRSAGLRGTLIFEMWSDMAADWARLGCVIDACETADASCTAEGVTVMLGVKEPVGDAPATISGSCGHRNHNAT